MNSAEKPRSTRLGKAEFESLAESLAAELRLAQHSLRSANVPALILLNGIDGSSKGDVARTLCNWLDTRGIRVHPLRAATEEESTRPEYWRYWRALPARGSIAILFGGWYADPVAGRVTRRMKRADFESRLKRIVHFERLLTDDGLLLAKIWLQLSADVVRERLEEDAAAGRTASPDLRVFSNSYERYCKVAGATIAATQADAAPWHVVDGDHLRSAQAAVGEAFLHSCKQRLERPASTAVLASVPETPQAPVQDRLAEVDLDQKLEDDVYQQRLQRYQRKLRKLAWRAHEQRTTTVVVLEGWDAAGKGSVIRRITAAIDPRLYQVAVTGPPTDEERAHHYLWRFWRQLPPAGQIMIFDRSWYGRVLVERVEGLASAAQWKRAYLEIVDFESQLLEAGIRLAKFWLHISKEEQLRRFQHRAETPWKQHKLTERDWEAREHWGAYEDAVNEMVSRTDHDEAKWTLVSAEDKHHARVTVCRQLSRVLD